MSNEKAKKPRITREYVLHWDLIEQTGVEDLDEFLYCLVNVLGISVGRHMRSVFVVGSYAHGGHAPDSDVDMCFVWRDDRDTEQDLTRTLWSLVEHLQRMSAYTIDPMYREPEGFLYDPDHLEHGAGPIMRLALREHSKLLWGEDIRPGIAPCRSRDALPQDVLAPALNWIKSTHCRRDDESLPDDARIVSPVADPAPQQDDRGYGDAHRVSVFVAHIARAVIFL